MKFHNRKEELKFFREKLGSDQAEFIALYGRRRVGKSRLMKKVLQETKGIYHLVSRESEKDQIQEFKQSIGQKYPGIEDIRNDWEPVLRFTAENCKTVVIDEFPYLIETDEEILKILQKTWDEEMKQKDTNMVLTGSSISMMESKVLGYESPLYGRRTGQWHLKPFEYNQISPFLPDYSKEDIIRTYAILGGTPYYLEQFNPEIRLPENIHQHILKKGSVLREEAEGLLQQELREPKNYFSILKAVARGKTKFNEIKNETGIPQNSVSKYLKTLQNLHIIQKRLPVTASEKSKRGRYRIKDNYFRFWFRYIFPNRTELEQNTENVLQNKIKPELDRYVSRPFEDICRSHVRQTKEYEKVGSWWYQENEIDVAAVNHRQNRLLLGECKWTSQPAGRKTLEKLREKSEKVEWKNSQRKTEYIIFSRNGFTEQLKQQDTELKNVEDLL
ncbi:MAG: ATP-binding protein [Candidatus Nanohaloarchaea archaeon]